MKGKVNQTREQYLAKEIVRLEALQVASKWTALRDYYSEVYAVELNTREVSR